jgi:hypothetical protein
MLNIEKLKREYKALENLMHRYRIIQERLINAGLPKLPELNHAIGICSGRRLKIESLVMELAK